MEIRISFDAEGRVVTELTGPPPRPGPKRPGWPAPLAKPDRKLEALWTDAHDRLLRELVELHRWWWFWEAPAAIARLQLETGGPGLPANTHRTMYFAQDRALRIGLYAELLGDAPVVACARCGSEFLEPDGRGYSLEGRADVCNDCLTSCLFGSPTATMGRSDVEEWVRGVAEAGGRVPSPGVLRPSYGEIAPLDTERRVKMLDLLARRPDRKTIKWLYESWLSLLVESGVLADGTRPTSRCTQCIASDGHACLSIGEKTVDDFLTAHQVAHEHEPIYPGGRFRGDWRVGEAIVEYVGLAGDAAYDEKAAAKARECADAGVRLVALYAEGVADPRRLADKLLGPAP